MKKHNWIVALVIVLAVLICAAWGCAVAAGRLTEIQLFFSGTTLPAGTVTAVPEPSTPDRAPAPQTMPSTESSTEPSTKPSTEPVAEPPTYTTEADTEPASQALKLTARQYIVYDTASGKTLCSQSGTSRKVYPASITKLFTAYVALQYLDPAQTVTVGKELDFVGEGSSRAWFRKGQTLTVEQVIQGLILPSGNDAAYILANAAGRVIAGDNGLSPSDAVSAFVNEMNAQARQLGMDRTHFMNPDGYHTGSHYISLEDAVTIAKMVLETPILAETVCQTSIRAELADGTVYNWQNTNKLINPDSKYYCPEACGLKTGHTTYAGFCLLSAIRQEEGYLIIGVFGCPGENDRFSDTLKLIDRYAGISSS